MFIRYRCYHENNVPTGLSPQWLCGNSCTWAHDIWLYIASTNEPNSAQQALILCSLRWPLFGLLVPAMCNVHHVSNCMSCHKAIVVITGRTHCFHDNIYVMLILLLLDLSTLCVVDQLWPLILCIMLLA